mgnify:CR=1 FL=1
MSPIDAHEEPFGVSDFYRITTLHPRTYNDARRVGEEFREGVPVIMNLTDMDDVDAKRLVDFAADNVSRDDNDDAEQEWNAPAIIGESFLGHVGLKRENHHQ